MMMSSLHLRLRLIFASACITHNALEKWSKASDRSCVFVWWVRRFSRLFLIDWLIRSSLSTVVCSAGQAKCSGVDGDSGIGAASYSWRTACGGGGVSSDWIQLVISQQTSGQLHHSHVNCVCSIRAGFWGSITRALPPSFTLISSAVTGSNSGFSSRMFTDSHPSHRLWVTWRDRHNATRNNEGQRASLRYAFWVIPSGSVLLQSSQRLNLSAVLHFVSSQPAAAPPSGTTQSAQFKPSALCTQGSLQRHHHKLRVWASAESNDSFQEVPQSCFY